ncbi:uncharacterized protein I303_108294 [Kwoniella dejecticola CBS 10117]|uniref:Uncharacterized protein n=1 Tax=Kwoniella dejecticola CBS 10117 TaxID=1296121 RepID=A0A1A5ZXT5_9TREE|nr:uncharacterized protein I303_07379 [Kwoniella dejecticola CBS 10117]OBR82617.1 hypothetical protein I303_07379 [Kwoniella dejecticola CBS 10117]
MSTRSNYFSSRSPLYPLIRITSTPRPSLPLYSNSNIASPSSAASSSSSSTCEKPPAPTLTTRQRTSRTRRPRELSILVPPPPDTLKDFKLVIKYTSASTTSANTTGFALPLKDKVMEQHKQQLDRDRNRNRNRPSESLASCLTSPLVLRAGISPDYEMRNVWDEETLGSDSLRRLRQTGLLFVCLGLVTLGFTMLVLVIIVPDRFIPIWQSQFATPT